MSVVRGHVKLLSRSQPDLTMQHGPSAGCVVASYESSSLPVDVVAAVVLLTEIILELKVFSVHLYLNAAL